MEKTDFKIDLFDEKNVGARVRRLAACFDIAARNTIIPDEIGNNEDEKDIIRRGHNMFCALTEDAKLPPLNADEKSYLKFKFLEIAIKLCNDKDPTFSYHHPVFTTKINHLVSAARELKVID